MIEQSIQICAFEPDSPINLSEKYFSVPICKNFSGKNKQAISSYMQKINKHYPPFFYLKIKKGLIDY